MSVAAGGVDDDRALATVTSPAEARQCREASVDGLVVQGATAGGHSTIFNPTQNPEPIGTDTLARRVLIHPKSGGRYIDSPPNAPWPRPGSYRSTAKTSG